MVVFLSMSFVITPPSVSIPSDSGVTSSSKHVFDVTGQYAALDGRTERDRLVRIDVAARLLAEEVLNLLLHLRHARLAADEDHLVDFRSP